MSKKQEGFVDDPDDHDTKPLTVRLFERARGIKAGDKFIAREISVEGHGGIELVRVED